MAFKDYRDETKRRTGLDFQERPDGARSARAGDPFSGGHNVTGDDRNIFARAPESKRKIRDINENPFDGHNATGTDEDFGRRTGRRRNYGDVIAEDDARRI